MKKKTTIAIAVTGLLAIAGCSGPVDLGPAETPTSVPTSAEHFIEYRPGGSKFIGPVEASFPAPSATETRSQSLGDILAPPTPAEPQEPIQGLLPPTSPWQPAPAPWQVELPEVTDLPPLPPEK